MKKLFLTITISLILAVVSADAPGSFRSPAPIVYNIESLPRYGRKKALRKFNWII